MRGVKVYGVLIKLMNRNFSRTKHFQELSTLEHFQWGGKYFGGKNFEPLQKSRFPTVITFPTFWGEAKDLPNHNERKCDDIA